MTQQAQRCQPSQFEAFLNGELNNKDTQQMQTHLDDCESCRRKLDAIAAKEDSWIYAQTFLKDDAFDRESVSGVSDESSGLSPQIAHVIEVLKPTDDPAMLGRLGGYEVSGVVGAGGMGVVLKAFDGPLDRTVAIKVLAPHLASSGAARQRFYREARAAAAVIHPNVIAIYGVSTDAALPFLVMPYVGGSSLQKRLDSQGALPVADILRIALQIASGLAAAHGQGLVHRDIKPANILLDNGVERLVITDFGLARAVDDASMTRTGVIAGTPQYMSPEQARGEFVDARSDLFSLGSVMYTMCSGRVPFRADSPYGVLRLISDNVPRAIREINPEIPVWLCRIVSRLHAKLPANRYQSANDVAAVLTACLAHVAQPTVHGLPSELVRPSLFKSSRFWRSAMAIGGASVLVAAGAIIFRPAPEEQSSNADTTIAASNPSPHETSGTESAPVNPTSVESIQSPSLLPDDTDLNNWDDQLDPVLQHIEEALKSMSE